MSESDTCLQPRTRSSFASRLLTKELDIRNKTSRQMTMSPDEVAKFAPPPQVEEKESAKVG